MKTISKIIITSSILLAPGLINAQSAKSQEVIDAVEKVYNEELQEDAHNYNVYLILTTQ